MIIRRLKAIYDELLVTEELYKKKELLLLLGGLPIAEYIEGQDRPEDYAEECACMVGKRLR